MFCGKLALKLEYDPIELKSALGKKWWKWVVKVESWKLKVENTLVSDVLEEDIVVAFDENLEDLEDIRSYQ